MDDHVRETLFGLCNFFDVISRKSIGVKQLNRLQEEIVEILCELEIYFPPAFFDIMVHLLVHVVDDIIHLGPTFLHNMMPFERLNGVIKGFVRNRARPDGSIAKGFLTYECISFCQNYLSTENEDVGLPTRKHVGRLAGFGHREGYRAMHVGIAGRHADFDRAHRVALQHIELVSPWVDKHKSLIEQKFIDLGRPRKTGDVTKEHNSTFTGWFKKRLLESPAPMPSTEEQKLIFSLSQGPGHNVRTYQSYDINGYRFYTEEKDKNSEYQNSGVTMLSYTDDKTDVKERFYGRIEEIWELDYVGVTMPMFRVRWAKSVEKDGLYFTTMVIPDAKSKTPSAKNEPWVLASQVDQCFFITDPSKPSRPEGHFGSGVAGIRLGGRSTGASSIIRQPIVRPPARRQLLPSSPLSHIPSPNEDDIDDDGPVDVDAYLNTGADIDDLYMAGADEEAYRARDEPAGPPKATKQRLVFRGFSEETPPAADTQEPTAANIFSPNTLIKKVNEQFEASGAVAPKKPRKRPSKNKEKSASQPPPTIRHRDSMVPPSKDGLTRMHEAGKPILGPELQHLASGDMLPLQDSILVLESILLKDKDPNYPVFTVRVPRDVGFVTDAPADIFFIAYEDIFKLFHSRRLDYNLVRLFALNLAMKIKRESTPDVAIADPYYMRESQLALSAVRVRASLYLQKCFLDNKRKDNILLAYFPEDTYCVLISIAPKYSLATYFDSGSAKKKNYARIRGVLDDALEGYFKKGGAFKEKAECFRDDGKHKFKHVFEFPCVKQPENSTLDAFYVMHHLKGFVRDSQNLLLPSALRGWAEKLARINDDDLREDFHDTKVKLSHIIIQDVTTGGGPLNQGRALCKRDIEHRLKAQGDTRTWITKDLYKPFPEPCEP
ncbi:hypothetical protein QYE76_039328 [Lolium multiflorum]|uniref:DUF4218 domain-containing protein n=1 Tax=Lolium multiflorum TaxID=4521 RepID=A0AAD8WS20_LOLMU|nr:hypothetical protein QYE76_039328 [Lolium multiflorum]